MLFGVKRSSHFGGFQVLFSFSGPHGNLVNWCSQTWPYGRSTKPWQHIMVTFNHQNMGTPPDSVLVPPNKK